MKKTIFMTLLMGMILVMGPPLAAQDSSFKVIVNSDNPVTEMAKKEVSNAFLKKTSKWGNGVAILPVDLVSSSDTREAFSQDIHERKVSAVKAYWQKQIFSGRKIPPAEKKSNREILLFVQENPGAIGYISSSTATGGYRVKTIEVK
jgi:ABC-type phosphate transport system substrate-binding protein